MTETPTPARRPSGRDARRAQRAGPLPDHLRPVKPGMESGRYQPLTADEVQKIHRTALRLLAEVGLADAPESGVEILTQGRMHPERERPAAVPGRAGGRHAGQGGAPFRAARAGPAARPRALGQAQLLRHGGRRGQHGRPAHRVPRIDDPRPLRHRPHRRRDGAHPFLPARRRAARHSRSVRDGLQHLLRRRVVDDQARGQQLGAAGARRRPRSRCCT